MIVGPSLGKVLDCALESGADLPPLSTHQHRVLDALRTCRTPALGGHRFRCTDCGGEHFAPHSCRNRHCPACQGSHARDWLEAQSKNLLPIPYFHVVFTIPHELNVLVRQNRKALYNLLFRAVSQTLEQFGRRNLKAQIGITAVLHTWSQTLLEHYHLHAIVTGGGPSLDGSHWIKANEKYLFNVHALAKVYRAKFREGLLKLFQEGSLEFHGQLAGIRSLSDFEKWLRAPLAKNWHVYSKPPFGGPQQVLSYLSRYTHRVALTPRRLLELDPATGELLFSWRDYADHSRIKHMRLKLPEFLRRFSLHILPERFVKIRHYGLLSNRDRQQRLEHARQLLAQASQADLSAPERSLPQKSADGGRARMLCPHCGHDSLQLIEVVPRPNSSRGPPVKR